MVGREAFKAAFLPIPGSYGAVVFLGQKQYVC